MCQFDHALVAGHEASGDQRLDQALVLVVGGEDVAGDPAPHRIAVWGRRDQAQHQIAQQRPLHLVDLLVDPLGGLGDRAADAAGLAVALHRERATLPPDPGLTQRVGQQRQGAGLTLHLTHQHVDQTRLEQQPVLPGGCFDRRAQGGVVHRAEQVQASLDEPGKRGMGGEIAEPVGAQGHHQRPACRVLDERVEEARPLGGIVTERERLLALVDHENGSGGNCAQRDERFLRVGSRREHPDLASLTLERRGDPCSHER